jgi:hypothetical protein
MLSHAKGVDNSMKRRMRHSQAPGGPFKVHEADARCDRLGIVVASKMMAARFLSVCIASACISNPQVWLRS